jgi:hypothetical protein
MPRPEGNRWYHLLADHQGCQDASAERKSGARQKVTWGQSIWDLGLHGFYPKAKGISLGVARLDVCF